MRYGFVGLGNLGGHLASSLLRGGFKLAVNDSDRARAEPHIRAGARWADTPRALGDEVDCVITCLPSPAIS
jgi:3-hydroxyisobutyrate dehydrogenase